MIKRTLYFGNPSYISTKDEQLVVQSAETGEVKTVPVEDTGIVILDNYQVTITQAALAKLLENNVAVITCNDTHHPTGLFLNLSGHTLQSARFRAQIDASEPLKKQLWQQTIQCKIENQAALLAKYNIPVQNMLEWAKNVRSGDPDNYEARAAAYYWRTIFEGVPHPQPLSEGEGQGFLRERFGEPPNNMLNYTYAVLRATVARSLVGSGLLPTLGIHHRNQYNAYCLADDIMEPYRPFADAIVRDVMADTEPVADLTPAIKKRLLVLPAVDILIDGQRSPLMVGLHKTTASLAACFDKKEKKILYPSFP